MCLKIVRKNDVTRIFSFCLRKYRRILAAFLPRIVHEHPLFQAIDESASEILRKENPKRF